MAWAAGPGGSEDDSARRWLILGVVCLGQLMVVPDSTVVNVALPSAQHDLVFSNADRQWVVTAYSLAFGGLLLLGGVLTEYLSWRWCLYVNVVFSVIAVTAAVRLLRRDRRDPEVRLDGPPELRVAQGAAVEGISESEARRHLTAADRARDTYVRRPYRADPADVRHYHLIIDSTVLPLDTVTEIILSALSRFSAQLKAERDAAATGR